MAWVIRYPQLFEIIRNIAYWRNADMIGGIFMRVKAIHFDSFIVLISVLSKDLNGYA